MQNLPCVILSGGRSSRMKEDKSLLSFKNYNSLIEFQYSKLSKIFSNLYISSKQDKFEFLNDKSKIIFDTNDIFSPMIALQSIFTKLKTKKIFIITVDNPFITKETIKSLIKNSDNFDITLAKTPQKLHNLCGVFDINILNDINKNIENDMHKINFMVKNSNFNVVEFLNEDEFLNINTQDDYRLALKY